MLIDEYLPRYDVVERHATVVFAAAERVYSALRTVDFGGSFLVRVLLGLRSLPAVVRYGARGVRDFRRRFSAPITLPAFEEHGFAILAEAPPHEMLIGLEGRFWAIRSGLQSVDAESFLAPPRRGTARAAWNFAIEEQPEGSCLLSTETRVLCADSASRRRFLPYWWVIRPGSGLIRRSMLRAIRKEAETVRQSQRRE